MENGIIEKIPVALSLISKFKLKLLELLVPIFPITALILYCYLHMQRYFQNKYHLKHNLNIEVYRKLDIQYPMKPLYYKVFYDQHY